jgi:hypothetical protein
MEGVTVQSLVTVRSGTLTAALKMVLPLYWDSARNLWIISCSRKTGSHGRSDPYIQGEPWAAGESIELVYDPKLIRAASENSQVIELTDTDYVLLSEEDVEEEISAGTA